MIQTGKRMPLLPVEYRLKIYISRNGRGLSGGEGEGTSYSVCNALRIIYEGSNALKLLNFRLSMRNDELVRISKKDELLNFKPNEIWTNRVTLVAWNKTKSNHKYVLIILRKRCDLSTSFFWFDSMNSFFSHFSPQEIHSRYHVLDDSV